MLQVCKIPGFVSIGSSLFGESWNPRYHVMPTAAIRVSKPARILRLHGGEECPLSTR